MKTICFTIILLLGTIIITAQELDKKEYKRLFLDAEYLFLFENYDKALPVYQEIYDNDTYHRHYNANLNFRIGFCIMKNPQESYKAYEYLEVAAKNITFNYRENNVNETQAPIEAFLYLGDSYRTVFEFDKAIYAYQKYESYLDVEDLEGLKEIKRIIQSCKSAKELMLLSDHNFVEVSAVSNEINSAYPEYNPVVSRNGNMMVFTSRRSYSLNIKADDFESMADEDILDEDIYFSKKINGAWTSPAKITNQLMADFATHCVSISNDGTQLLLVRNDVGLVVR